MKVAVLGCGPAGLLSALAIEQCGHKPVIFSNPIKSRMPGAQFLHAAIPGLTPDEPELFINFLKRGSAQGYAAKVYGRRDAPTSWDAFPEGRVGAWSLARAYDLLWERYRGRIVAGEVGREGLDLIEDRFDAALSTIPAQVLCDNPEHTFDSTTVWIRTGPMPQGVNVIEYNGQPLVGYYRSSSIEGHGSVEFGHPVRGADPGVKPLGTNCDCRHRFYRLGRFGTWKKGVLVHHAYEEAKALINALY